MRGCVSGAYPRAGGGTGDYQTVESAASGLSPRRRGNRFVHVSLRVRHGPIPAQAGEPSPVPRTPPQGRAYPRAGGGTVIAQDVDGERWGLSPRRRGNQLPDRREWGPRGPIPAQAGEPFGTGLPPGERRAYPRAGGGTRRIRTAAHRERGLSPRRRGNHHCAHRVPEPLGPIPAQAGEPPADLGRQDPHQAYPRAGGGTGSCRWNPCSAPGLSPRRRGNPTPACLLGPPHGPIPAQAGEPEAGPTQP